MNREELLAELVTERYAPAPARKDVHVMADQWPTEPCKSCGKPVIWCVTTRGRSMPVNAKPSPGGNILLYNRTGTGFPPLAEVLTVARQFGLQGKLRTSHFVTCPQAKQWRRPRTRKAAR